MDEDFAPGVAIVVVASEAAAFVTFTNAPLLFLLAAPLSFLAAVVGGDSLPLLFEGGRDEVFLALLEAGAPAAQSRRRRGRRAEAAEGTVRVAPLDIDDDDDGCCCWETPFAVCKSQDGWSPPVGAIFIVATGIASSNQHELQGNFSQNLHWQW